MGQNKANTKKGSQKGSKKGSKKTNKNPKNPINPIKNPIKKNSSRKTSLKNTNKKSKQKKSQAVLSRSKGNKKKWTSFSHNGIVFYHPYVQHNVPVIYNGENIKLSALAEEYASLYTKCLDSCGVNARFNRNFWKSWKPTLKGTPIKKIDGCDFSLIKAFLDEKKDIKANISIEEKKQMTEKKKQAFDTFKKAMVDEHEQIVGNFLVEPPGIFIGRGSHPLLGTIKERVSPSDVTINIGPNAPVPKIFYLSTDNELVQMDKEWGEVIHDNTVEWVASWIDKVMGKRKYVWLSDTCQFKSTSDMKKFDLARKLRKKIGQIRSTVSEHISSDDIKLSQMGIAIYLIDNLALRVGNEKGGDEADTVGVTSLRVEHITLDKGNTLTLDFLGKDSMRYTNSIKVESNVYDKLVEFTKNKDSSDQLFERITSCDINNFLQTLMKNLTAKSFRTFNASYTFQHKLKKIMKKYEDLDVMSNDLTKEEETDIMKQFERANIEVAKLCNHQKAVSKGTGKNLAGIKEKINEIMVNKRKLQAKKNRTKGTVNRINKMNTKIKDLKAKLSLKSELKNISLTTSKVNYIDPRIVYAFAAFFNLPIEKFYSTSLAKKFSWAEDVDETFKF